MENNDFFTDTTPDDASWEDPLERKVSSGNLSGPCPICVRSPRPNAPSKEALRQMREGEMNEYKDVESMIESIT